MSNQVQLYLGDCIDIFPTIETGSIDLVLTDPPYGIRITKAVTVFGDSPEKSRKATNDTWDDEIPSKAHFDHIFRVSSNQIVFGANYFWSYFYASPCYIVWDKRGTLPPVPFADTEFAWTSFERMSKKYTVINHGFIRDDKEPRYHPTQKPLILMKQIIEDFTKPGDLILDCFMGSGTTGVACMNTGRRFIGIERDETYFNIAAKRIADASRAAQRLPKQLTGTPTDFAGLPMFMEVA